MKNIFGNIKSRKNLTWFYPRICDYQDAIHNQEKFFSFLNSKSLYKNDLLLYIHIPFCDSFCAYCACFKEANKAYTEEQKKNFVHCLIKEMEMYSQKEFFKDTKVKYIQFGGGTPSCLSNQLLKKIFEGIKANFDLSGLEGISFEGNAMTLKNIEKLELLKELGVNRLSFGVQTFNEHIRKDLNIQAKVNDIFETAERIRKVGIPFYAIDLIYNLPNQTFEILENDINIATQQLKPDYIQTYRFNLFNNTLLEDKIKNNHYEFPPSPEKEYSMFEIIMEKMKENHYSNQILINLFSNHSNPASTGLELSMGNGNEFSSKVLGIGPGSSSYLDQWCYKTVCSVKKYCSRIGKKIIPVESGFQMSEEELLTRSLVFFPNIGKLNIEYKFTDSQKEKMEFLIKNGYVYIDNNTYYLTQLGKMWAAEISYLFYSDNEKVRYRKSYYYSIKAGKNPFNQDNMNTSNKRKGKKHECT